MVLTSLLAIVVALVIEQLRPLDARRLVQEPLQRLSARVIAQYCDGQASTGRFVWLALVIGACVAALVVDALLSAVHGLFGFAFTVAVLYFCIGFRDHNRSFSDIHVALRTDEPDRARALLSGWRGADHRDASPGEIVRLAIEQALVASHRSFFGTAFWFIVLPGPVGAVMYRLACFLAEDWGRRRGEEFGRFGEFAQRAFEWVDWVPVRLTAIAFSVVGNFEDALFCWRSQSMLWPDKHSGILIASGAGALGARLGMPVHESGTIVERPEMGVGDEANADHMQSALGLVWRALMLYLLALGLVGIAAWVGR